MLVYFSVSVAVSVERTTPRYTTLRNTIKTQKKNPHKPLIIQENVGIFLLQKQVLGVALIIAHKKTTVRGGTAVFLRNKTKKGGLLQCRNSLVAE